MAERLNREWVGIDITMLAVNLIKHRLRGQFIDKNIKITVDGIPKDISGAEALFRKNPFEFEYWVLDIVDAVPSGNKTKENMKGADSGIDGVINFAKDFNNGKPVLGKVLVQVKGGGVHRNDIATLKGDVEREKAEGGLLVTLEEPTQPMRQEAVEAGIYEVHYTKKEFPKIQIITVRELLLLGKRPDMPAPSKSYYKEAEAEDTTDKTANFEF